MLRIFNGLISDLVDAIVEALSMVIDDTISDLMDTIWEHWMTWLYKSIYGSVANLFSNINSLGAGLFDLDWVAAVIELFTLFGWSLFIAGLVVAVFELAYEYQTGGRTSIKTTALNVLKGFFACSLVGIVPVELYKFCVSLQNTFAMDLVDIFAGHQVVGFWGFLSGSLSLLGNMNDLALKGLGALCMLIAFAYCLIKVFFSNIKRGGILLIQIAVGELYMFSIPRGYTDGFNQWCKQVIALCLTTFLQTTLLFLGLMTFETDMLMGLGIMLAASEVPKIAQQFGLDSSVRVNISSVVYSTTSVVNASRALFRPK